MNSDRYKPFDEHHLKALSELSNGGNPSQRELSKKLGLSLGKVNYIVSNLAQKGLIKAKRFKNSKNKLAYMYILTPKGIAQKVELTHSFLRRKMEEYEALEKEIEEMKKDLEALNNKN